MMQKNGWIFPALAAAVLSMALNINAAVAAGKAQEPQQKEPVPQQQDVEPGQACETGGGCCAMHGRMKQDGKGHEACPMMHGGKGHDACPMHKGMTKQGV